MPSDHFWAQLSNSLGARGLRWTGKLNVPVYRLSGGRIGGKVGEAPVLLLTTTGRKSGEQRTAPVLYLDHGEAIILIDTNAGNERLPGLVPQPEGEPGGRGRDRARERRTVRRPGRRGRRARRALARLQRPVRGLRRLRQVSSSARPRSGCSSRRLSRRPAERDAGATGVACAARRGDARRRRRCSLGGGLAAAALARRRPPAPRRAATRPRIAIVGAGLAGLTCAYRLHQRGIACDALRGARATGSAAAAGPRGSSPPARPPSTAASSSTPPTTASAPSPPSSASPSTTSKRPPASAPASTPASSSTAAARRFARRLPRPAPDHRPRRRRRPPDRQLPLGPGRPRRPRARRDDRRRVARRALPEPSQRLLRLATEQLMAEEYGLDADRLTRSRC